MSNFWKALDLVEVSERPKMEYRLYYDKATGEPLFYTMQKEEGDYILVSKEEFAQNRYDIIVKDGKITKPNNISIGKLAPANEGFGTIKRDVSIVGNEIFWKVKTYE